MDDNSCLPFGTREWEYKGCYIVDTRDLSFEDRRLITVFYRKHQVRTF
jgi:hypothetical protein